MLSTVPCDYPFTSMTIGPGGDCWFCCPEWIANREKACLGNVLTSSIKEVWNSSTALAIRRAMYDNDIDQWCRKKGCPVRHANAVFELDSLSTQRRGELFDESTVARIRQGTPTLEGFPSYLNLGHDYRCNLKCIMCASPLYTKQYGNHGLSVDQLTEKIFAEITANIQWVRRIYFSVFGDPFASKRLLMFMQRDLRGASHVELEVLTNGLLLTPKMWKSIAHNRFRAIRVSVDGARRETYEKIRLGGRWKTLMHNLTHLGEVRRTDSIESFEITMTVMKLNYREMYEFFDLGMKLGCDCVSYQYIMGDLGNQDFWRQDIDWNIVGFVREFFNSETGRNPRCYVEYLRHIAEMTPPRATAARGT